MRIVGCDYERDESARKAFGIQGIKQAGDGNIVNVSYGILSKYASIHIVTEK